MATPATNMDASQPPATAYPNPPASDLEKQVVPPTTNPAASSSSVAFHKGFPHPETPLSNFIAYLKTPVNPTHSDLLLLLCCFTSGLVDSTIYDAFGTFVSMQTGNTVFLGLGSSTPDTTSKPYGWAKSFVSIVFFAAGCMFFSHGTAWLGNQKRGTLCLSFGVQAIIVFVAAAVVQGGVVQGSLQEITDDIDWWTALPIALLSFQSAGQIVGSRALGLAEIPTVVLTSLIHDLTTDRKLLVKPSENVKRNRRTAAFFVLLAGAVAGGWIAEGTKRMQIPLWIAGGVKLGIVGAWLVWPGKKASAGEA